MGALNRRFWLFLPLFCAFLGGYIIAKLHTNEILKAELDLKVPAAIRQESYDSHMREESSGPKKYFLDCGANVASSVVLFRETYPKAHEYIIHSFELDEKLKPYFIPHTEDGKTFPHIPMAVSDKNGHMTAYLEGAWYPGKVNNKRDMQWGGGSLFAKKDEIANKDGLGGIRRLSRHIDVPMVDLSEWIRENTRKEDYVIFKLDVEGAEYGILKKMLADNTFDWVDKFYGEFHPWQPTGYTKKEMAKIKEDVQKTGVQFRDWAGEQKSFSDFDDLITMNISPDTPGSVDKISNECTVKDGKTKVAIVIEVGMNAKTAKTLIGAIAAHSEQVPLTLFLYGDFVEQNANLVKKWSETFDIGVRAGRHVSSEYWLLQNKNILRMDIVSALRKFENIGLSPAYIFPSAVNDNVKEITRKRDLRIIDSTYTFPANRGGLLKVESYFKYRDVERTPKALKLINDALEKKGGILSLDADFPDSYMISAFLLDFLFEGSSHKISSLHDCLS